MLYKSSVMAGVPLIEQHFIPLYSTVFGGIFPSPCYLRRQGFLIHFEFMDKKYKTRVDDGHCVNQASVEHEVKCVSEFESVLMRSASVINDLKCNYRSH